MDHIAPQERDFEIDLENGLNISTQDTSKDSVDSVKTQAKELLTKICSIFVDDTIKGELGINLSHDAPNSNGIPVEQLKLEGEKAIDHAVAEKKVVKEKRKKMGHKKSPKPPRPPRGPSLDAADQKLIKEITELAMLKRARVERMKALKKMKAAKGSPSNGNIFAMVFTALFCLVIIFQGMSSRVSPVNVQGTPISAETAASGLIAVQYFGNPSASDPISLGSGSPSSVKPIAGFDHPENLRRAV
ncbi:uncharacterized protein LOC8258844 [Ricinus communis]|uniref:Transmembrane protein n=1 Tax=Ricinus communis TaxID=3988 RepID=B9RZT5_RICCO|nr:uncharacterized protein LOC8258844 [Ricinus communis]EEF43118.1 conserved hypothetical protein [Ricinus communis]|eukprot:XP_002519254.1 uncharacterized protein LOC8258844 [Ricinus communis]